jgi:hypothetical protein
LVNSMVYLLDMIMAHHIVLMIFIQSITKQIKIKMYIKFH